MKRLIYLFAKRFFDILAALVGLIVTSPLWLIAVIGIEISDPGPIFYKAKRIGKNNKPFYMWKFRSMRVPKDESEKSEASFKADTNRIFPWGAIMRRLKIDELAQLLNVIIGSMSVVGPRPAAKDQVKIMRAGKYGVAASVKPGLTGPAALYDYIYGDTVENPNDYEKKVLPTRLELEALYPLRMSLGFDIKMVWWTVVCVLSAMFDKKPKNILNKLISFAGLDDGNALERGIEA